MAHAERLLVRVQRRLQLRAAGRAFGRWLPVFASAWLAWLLISRLLHVGPEPEAWTVALVPALAALLALLTHARANAAAAATAVDTHAHTHDLFLTRTWLADAPGEFGPLVEARAEACAREVRAEAVVPLQPWPGTGIAGAIVLALLVGVLWLPRTSSGGKSTAQAQQGEALQQQRREAERRIAALREQQVNEPHSPAVAAAIAELERALQQAQRAAVAQNHATLHERQQQFGEAWRAANRAASQGDGAGAQEFGARMDARMQEWKRELERGQAGAVEKELEQLRDDLRKLEHASAAEQGQQMQELRKRLENLADLAASAGRGSAADQALRQALAEMQMLAAGELSEQALAALQQSLEQAQLEFGAQAQNFRNREELERALRTMQLAQHLNDLGELDGKECEGCKSLADYAELYQKRLQARLAAGELQCAHCNGTGQHDGQPCGACAGTGHIPGGAFGGPGIGQGGKAPEDPSTQTAFQPERSLSAPTAGKMLMQTSGKGAADSGEAQRDLQQALQQVRQGSTEAILQERVPPGYHDAIRKYFDDLGRRDH